MYAWIFLTGIITAFLIPTVNFYLNDRKKLYLFYGSWIVLSVIFILYTFKKYDSFDIGIFPDGVELERILQTTGYLFYYLFLLEVVKNANRQEFLKRLLQIQVIITILFTFIITYYDNIDSSFNVDVYLTGPLSLISFVLNFLILYYMLNDSSRYVRLIAIAFLVGLSITFVSYIFFLQNSFYSLSINPHKTYIIALILELTIINHSLNSMNYAKIREVTKQQVSSELKALRAQVNPHFIFNCLNAIQSYIKTSEIDSAMSYLGKFSRLMRQSLIASDQSLIPLDEEVEMIKNFLSLQNLRFSNQFEFTVKAESLTPLNSIMIPSMLTQPFVENAVIHGIKHMKSKGRIDVNYKEEASEILVTVKDNGKGMVGQKDKDHRSMGLSVCKERLRLLTGNSDSLTIESDYEKGTLIQFTVKARYSP